MDWTEETIARLRALWDEGHSTAEMGRRLGVTKNAVVGKAHRLNLPARPSPIRRGTGEGRPPRRAARRTNGPTLPVLAAALTPASPVPAAARQADSKIAPVVRVVQAVSRPAGRLSACCWPLGDPGTSSFHFCGEQAIHGKPYCPEHAAVAYVKVRDRREDAA